MFFITLWIEISSWLPHGGICRFNTSPVSVPEVSVPLPRFLFLKSRCRCRCRCWCPNPSRSMSQRTVFFWFRIFFSFSCALFSLSVSLPILPGSPLRFHPPANFVRMKGTRQNSVAMAARTLPAALGPSFSNICVVKSGKMALRSVRKVRRAVNALVASLLLLLLWDGEWGLRM